MLETLAHDISNGEDRTAFFQLSEQIAQQLKHRSYREFVDESVPEATLDALAEVVRWTASSTGQQRFSVIRLSDPELKKQVAEVCTQEYLGRAPEFWVFIVDLYKHKETAKELGADLSHAASMDKFFQGFTDACLAAQNLTNAVESLGMGAVFIGSIHNNDQKIIELLNLPELCFPAVGVCFGVPNQHPQQKPRLPHSLRFFENGYQRPESYLETLKDYDDCMDRYYDLRNTSKSVGRFSAQVAKMVESKDLGREAILDTILKQGFTNLSHE